jgi:DNA (cytosine-5)-methyltransferase 1
LQTFADDFIFVGNASEQALLIGNAVPPLLAFRIAQSLRLDLERPKSVSEEGALLSFVPTTSTGMSPALQRTSDLLASQANVNEAQTEFPFVTV